MKKLLMIIVLGFFVMLSGCFETYDPNIVLYTKEEAIEIAEEKYDIKEWFFTDYQIRNEILFAIVEGENAEEAIDAFAGMNGNHDIKGMFRDHKCYIAYGVTNSGEHKFIYYNISISKDMPLVDAIGASKYPYECSYEDIAEAVSNIDSTYVKNKLAYLKDIDYDKLQIHLLDKFTIQVNFKEISYGMGLKLYKENDNVVVDVVNLVDSKNEIFYSSSSNFEYIVEEVNNSNYDTFIETKIRLERIYNDDTGKGDWYAYFYVVENVEIEYLDVSESINFKFSYTADGETKEFNSNWAINGITTRDIYRSSYIDRGKILIAAGVDEFTYDEIVVSTNNIGGFVKYKKLSELDW